MALAYVWILKAFIRDQGWVRIGVFDREELAWAMMQREMNHPPRNQRKLRSSQLVTFDVVKTIAFNTIGVDRGFDHEGKEEERPREPSAGTAGSARPAVIVADRAGLPATPPPRTPKPNQAADMPRLIVIESESESGENAN